MGSLPDPFSAVGAFHCDGERLWQQDSMLQENSSVDVGGTTWTRSELRRIRPLGCWACLYSPKQCLSIYIALMPVPAECAVSDLHTALSADTAVARVIS